MTAPLRALHVLPGAKYGGLESYLATIARNPAYADGVTHEFAVCDEGRLSTELRAAGARVHVLGSVRLRHPWSVHKARKELLRVLGAERYGAMVCHMLWTQIVFGPVARKRPVPLAFFLHGVVDPEHPQWLERLARRVKPDRALCACKFTSTGLRTLYERVPIDVCYYAVPQEPRPTAAEDRRDVRREMGVADGTVVIAQVSRMADYKGHTLHLDALGQLRDVAGWECWLVGGAQAAEEQAFLEGLKDRARRLGIAERVRFLGERRDVPRLLPAVDIHCQPNLRPEAFGITFIEALAAGVPVVTTAMGGPLEIVDESTGVLVPPEAGALAEALGGLVRDSDRRARLGRAGPARARGLCDVEGRMGDLAGALRRVASRA